ncbi:hypothetical protein GN330_03160 [Nitratireductor sp. CAU 1489]|uniref:Uncharacterized protein n=1 Tax=Nitratireductor arenosus TaxID=2682096 RepID=A0A844QEL1_9HYPH|nr:hypothetical protein [Nitratireductor arenosus]
MMGTGNSTDEFKRDAVAQITERGYPVAASIYICPGHRREDVVQGLYALTMFPACSVNWPTIAPPNGRLLLCR